MKRQIENESAFSQTSSRPAESIKFRRWRRGRRQKRRGEMFLLAVVLVEAFMIDWNLNNVEQSLEVRIAIGRIEELFKRNILELRMSKETVDEKASVIVARGLRIECIVGSNLELARLTDFDVPIIEVSILHWNNRNNNHWS